jgi:hypothetical protein
LRGVELEIEIPVTVFVEEKRFEFGCCGHVVK